MQFLKEHLTPGNYEWNDQISYNGKPSRRLYNRYNGNQLLFVINHIAESTATFDIFNFNQKCSLLWTVYYSETAKTITSGFSRRYFDKR